MPKQFEYCRVCRRNHDQGRGHRYSASHKRFLELLLGKLLQKIKEAKLFVKSAVPKTDGGQKQEKFWCDSCEKDITEQGSLFERAETIKHFASQEHIAGFERFLVEHGGDVINSLYYIEAADFSQWEKSCKESEAALRASLHHSFSVASGIQFEAPAVRISPENRVAESSTLNATPLAGLSTVRDPLSKPVEGNVHTGAPPPWLKQSVQGSDETLTPAISESCPALFLSRTQERKLAKLRNPKRVGAAWAERKLAELELRQRGEAAGDDAGDASSWLPSFGRVWQSGSRRDTRKEFEAEKRRAKRGTRPAPSESASIKSPDLKPYISKRQRMAMAKTDD